jgi:hypothetical protein
LGVGFAACGGDDAGNETATTEAPSDTDVEVEVDSGSVDDAIDLLSRAARTLSTLSGGLEDIIAQYQLAESDLRSAVQILRPGIAGVPEDETRDAALAIERAADALASTGECFASIPSGADPCSGVGDEAAKRAREAGASVFPLVPYGTRSRQEVSDLFSTRTTGD